MQSLHHPLRLRLATLALAFVTAGLAAGEATFYRAINLNGPAVAIDGRQWEGKTAANLVVKGNAFANQAVPLKPATDPARAQMIRGSRWGSVVDLTLRAVPAGDYQVFLYVWEDNHNERFDVLVNGRTVLQGFESGAAGAWKRLGPWPCSSVDGTLVVSARAPSHGAANLSGLEVWSGLGAVPTPAAARFAESPTTEQLAFFEQRIRPVLSDHCYECHSAQSKKIKGGLMLDSRAGMQKGGDTGAAVTPGDPEASLLVQAVRHADPDLAMPPKKKLPDSAISDLETWVRMGAPDPRNDDTLATMQAKSAIDWAKARDWWSLRPVTAAPPPPVQGTGWPVGDIDRFILARIEQAGLKPGAEASKAALIRRATFDLTGLPPTPEEVAAFLADGTAAAFATVVDRLLASPRYGERWGRHWLDVVRYADTAGDNSDFPIPQLHRYRDWVIAAFNRDLPYDQFVSDQLAGDLLGGEGEERLQRLIATGYLANARRFGSRVDDYPQHLTIEDTIDNLGRTFLGLSVNCARCHDHKFDPIATKDYYALYGIFNSTRYPWPGIELEQKQRDLVPLVAPDQRTAAEAQIAEKQMEQGRLDNEAKKLKDALKNVPAEEKKAHEELIKTAEKTANEHKSKPLPFEQAYAVADGAKRADAAVQIRGDPAKPGETVRRHFLTALGGAELPSNDGSSGRRALAEWILAKDNPLTARVMANRIWHHHFGRGLVPTPNDFGKQGKPPTHPELLDHLASRLRMVGWSVKTMHREIMLSRTYRLATTRDAEAIARDANNDLLAAYPRRRLDAESLRDTLLALGGNLDLSPAGAHPFPKPGTWNFTQHNPFKAVYASDRRSVFLMTQRIQRHPYLAIFDGADPSTSTPARPTSTTPLQALFLLNDPLIHEQAKRVAQRLLTDAGDRGARIQRAYALLFARPATAEELAAADQFLTATTARLGAADTAADRLEAETWASLVRVLFRLNEFVYLD